MECFFFKFSVSYRLIVDFNICLKKIIKTNLFFGEKYINISAIFTVH